jgi:hypothetical protein
MYPIRTALSAGRKSMNESVAAAENSRLKGLRSGEAFASGLPFPTAQNIQMQTLSIKTVESCSLIIRSGLVKDWLRKQENLRQTRSVGEQGSDPRD